MLHFFRARGLLLVASGMFLASFASAAAVTISDADYEGRPQFKIETTNATYFYDRAGGGFSRLFDRAGVDWVAFKKDPLNGRFAAGAGYRGIPNMVFGANNPDAGAGHPGHDKCESTMIAADAIRTVSKSGRWAWTWRFTEENAVLTVEQADPDHSYWFLYEGPIGGRWAPRANYWGTNRGGPRREMPFGRDKLYDQWRWVYFGADNAPRVLLLGQVGFDNASETLWYMGTTAAELDAPDGMIVFGFGRGANGPELRGAGQRFVLGFVEQPVKDAATHRRVANRANDWLKAAEAPVRVSETTLHGDLECFRIETPGATYLYGKRGAGFASILDPQGRDWIGYRRGGRAEGEFRGLPKSAATGGWFHCDYGSRPEQADNPFLSKVVVREPGHVRIHSQTRRGDAACTWDFYPTHATLTLFKVPGGNHWFTYEGAPGGRFDLTGDFTLRPDGQRMSLAEPWTKPVPWVMFGAQESPHGLLLVNHQTGSPADSYTAFPYQLSERQPAHQMAVFGFGRPDWRDAARKHVPQLGRLPARFSIAMTPTSDAAAAEAALRHMGSLATDSKTENLFGPPAIEVWYGDEQHFGRRGMPQKWINILGCVRPGDGLAAVTYSLNGGTPMKLSTGADGYRLARPGDYNVDLEFDALREGANELKLIAVDEVGRRTERIVRVIAHRGRTWPLPYSVDWRDARAITDAVQIVDGNWRLEAGGVRTVETYYDRILAFGDRSWTDYTVTAEVTFHGYTPPRGGPPTYGVSHAALAARYPGHFADARQPHVQWYPVGAVAEFRLGLDLGQSSWRIFVGGAPDKMPAAPVETRQRTVALGVTYQLMVRVDTLADGAARYRTKSWQAGAPEPTSWDMDVRDDRPSQRSGGALLVAHNTDVTFGRINARPNAPE